MLTVRELIGELDVRLLAGEGNLDLPVRWVHMTELLDPTPWLSGGEVLLTTGMQLDTPARQREFVKLLADHQLAGLGFGTGFSHEQVPAALVTAARRRDFPVFAVPYETPFIAITEAAFSKLVNEQYAVLRRALSAQERLERVVLSERGLEALAGTLATLVGATVIIFDPRGELLAQHGFRRQLAPGELELLRSGVRERIGRRDHVQFMPALEDPSRALAIPVASEAGGGSGVPAPEAWLVAVKDDAPLSDFDRLALRQAVTIVALELLRERVAGDTERRLAGDLLAGLLAGELTGPDLQRRLEPFGLSGTVSVLVLPKPGSSLCGNGRGPSLQLQEAALATALRAEATPALVASNGQAVALVPGLEEEELFALATRVADRVSRELGGHPARVGVGRAVAGVEARRGYQEARCTLEALELGLGAPQAKVATYRDLGSFQLLLSLQDDEALKLFCDSVLGPIQRSEGYYGGELMRSLEAFIEENGQWERAAKRLYCHRHTLRYRIRRVEELTGRDLGSARDRIEFWLALRGRELVR
ncbi:MAG: PucR family transcriptional regulator ligand-binding domain-containing protein [Actinomycetota bacterium]|nr:PucR family transcriptional regulator ligand-binding domain-containing protein [Actinomycetota bacterium]